jgi:hypothetical protein
MCETCGHSAIAGGLRGHSMGDTYPLTVIGKGDGFALLNLLTGEEGPVRPTYMEALKHRELNEPCPPDCPRINRLCAWCDYHLGPRPESQQWGPGRVIIGGR